MRGYMEYLEELFLSHIGWNVNDSFSNITLASHSVLDFSVPQGANLNLASQTTPNTFTDYTLKNLGAMKSSISYLYSSCPEVVESSANVPLRKLVQCFRKYPLKEVENNRGCFLFGRMYLPGQQLEAMYIQSIGVRNQLVAKWVVDPRLPSPVVLTATMQSVSKSWTREYVYSTHENLFGMRFLTNLCTWYEPEGTSKLVSGMELYYAANKKSPGIAAGIKYSSRSLYSAVPLTLSLVLNPIVGSVSAAYTLKPSSLSALSTRFDFNLYSYMSDLTVGCELWRNTPISLNSENLKEHEREGPVSVIKASTSLASQTAQVLWEGSIRGFLTSAGVKFCYGDRAMPIMTGLELTYSR